MRARIIVAIVVIALCLVAVIALRRGERSRGPAPNVPHVANAPPEMPAAAVASPDRAAPTGRAADGFRPPAETVRDRALRDDVRRRILAAWSEQLALPDAAAADAGDPLRLPMPTLDGGTVDPDYLRARIREDFLPMARACYEQFETRHPGVGGRSVAEFVIVGDERLGAVVDDVRVDSGDGGLAEAAFETCMRESMYTVAFRPPPGRGSLRVRYPFRFEASAPDAGR